MHDLFARSTRPGESIRIHQTIGYRIVTVRGQWRVRPGNPPHDYSQTSSTRRLEKTHYRVAVLEFFGFPPDFRQLQCIAFAVAEDKQTVAREQRRQMQVVEQLLGKRRGAATDILLAVRRVGENQIELLTVGRQLPQRGEGIL